jgi:PAS domain S-box-containing protein
MRCCPVPPHEVKNFRTGVTTVRQGDVTSTSLPDSRIPPSGPQSRTLVRALRGLVLASLILPAALLAAASVQDWQQLHDAAGQRARRTAAVLREHALKVFETHELILDRIDDRTRGMTWAEIDRSEALHSDLKRMATGYEHLSSLLLVSPDGRLSNNTRRFPVEPPVNNADRAYFRVPQSDPNVGTFIDEPVRGRVSGEPIINVSRRKSSASGEFDGVIAVAVFLDYFSRFYRNLYPQGEDSVTLARADGTVLVREPPTTTGIERLSPQSGLMRSIAAASTGFYETVSELDKVRRLHAYEKVGPYPLYVSYGVSLSAVRQEWLRNLKVSGMFALLGSIGLAIVTWIALRQARREQSAVESWRTEAIERERAERLYRTLYNKAPIPQQSLDSDGILLNVSDTWLELLGYEREAVIGRPMREFLPNDLHDRFNEARSRLMQTGAIRDVALEVQRRSGERVPVLWSGRVERDSDGQFVKTFGALVDITERRKAEQTLAQLQKMEAVGQLVAGVGHDFNNLLQAMSGCLQMIDRRVSDPKLKTILEAGQQAIDRGAKLTQQLMGFARKEALRPEPVDVPDQVLGMCELLARALRENIKLDVEFGHDLWPALVDPTQFEVAILNLAVNARDAMPNGGTLRIGGRNVRLGPGDHADGLIGDFVRVTVSDTGSGMPPDVLARAFDPFFTTKEVGKGTGLGLSQVYGFARQSGGGVEIESTPGAGTAVHLLLPRSEQSAATQGRVRRTHGAIDGLKVLFVEDDPVVGTMVGAALEDLGCKVIRATTAEDALDVLKNGAEIELLFSDIVMPGRLSGVELAKEARLLRPDLGVVLTTGYSEDVARLEGTRVLAKPYRMEALARALATERRGQSAAQSAT